MIRFLFAWLACGFLCFVIVQAVKPPDVRWWRTLIILLGPIGLFYFLFRAGMAAYRVATAEQPSVSSIVKDRAHWETDGDLSRYIDNSTGRIVGSVRRTRAEWEATFRLRPSPQNVGQFVTEGQAKVAVEESYGIFMENAIKNFKGDAA